MSAAAEREPGGASVARALDWLPEPLRVAARVRTLAAGEALFRLGDPAGSLFVVEAGRVRMARPSPEADPVVLHTAGPGDLLAEGALFAETYQCDANAITPARVRAYPKRDLLAAFRDDPALADRFMALLAQQIHALRTRLEVRNLRSARARVLRHLALLGGGAVRVRLEGTLMELAAELGLSHEALYRTLAALEREGRIRRGVGEIVLLEVPPL